MHELNLKNTLWSDLCHIRGCTLWESNRFSLKCSDWADIWRTCTVTVKEYVFRFWRNGYQSKFMPITSIYIIKHCVLYLAKEPTSLQSSTDSELIFSGGFSKAVQFWNWSLKRSSNYLTRLSKTDLCTTIHHNYYCLITKGLHTFSVWISIIGDHLIRMNLILPRLIEQESCTFLEDASRYAPRKRSTFYTTTHVVVSQWYAARFTFGALDYVDPTYKGN